MKKIYLFMMVAALSSGAALAQCVKNGDFEKRLDSWRFKHRALSYTQVGCDIDTNQPGFVGVLPSASPNAFSAPYGTIVSEGFDPFLQTCSPSVNVTRTILNKYAMKLNRNDGNADITSMYQYFAGAQFISFNYAFSAKNTHQGDPDHQPFFTARIIDPGSGTILTSYCLKADNTDPIFSSTYDAVGGEIVYTGWQCKTLYIPKEYEGKELLLEFVVADCGASKDFGTVYIDNVNCRDKCQEIASCIENGDFEKDVLDPWAFKHRSQSYTQVGCDMDTNDPGFVGVTPSNIPDQFLAPYGTRVSDGLDPFLQACSPSVNIQRVISNKYAMKLNVNDGNADVTSMYQPFAGAEFITFSYAFSAKNTHQGDPDHQPFFTARIIDISTGAILTSYCLKADNTDPIFSSTYDAVGGEIVYTGWHCKTLYVPKEYVGKELLLEFVVADCGASKDFGTVYIDNINCKEKCQEITECIENGDFEKDVLDPWTFKHRSQSYTQVGCDIDTNDPGFVGVTPSNIADQFLAPYGTRVSDGLDPFLLACSPSISIPRVIMNKYAMKLNVNDGNADITSMSQSFKGAHFISFSYAFSAQNSHQGDPDHQPFFTARIIDAPTGTILTSFCIKADNTNPIFGTTYDPVGGGEIIFTNWHCETLYVPEEYIGKELLLEFVVADCGASKDFGTVYLDNINCQEKCERSEFRLMQGNTGDMLIAYPNPVNNILNISGAQNTGTFVITDMFGKQLIRIENAQKASDLTIDVSGLATGVYLLSSDGANVTKIIKN